MRIRIIVLGLVLALVAVIAAVEVPVADGKAQAELVVADDALAIATDVVSGAVLATQSIESEAEVHTLALIDIESALVGSLTGQILVEVPGGQTASGLNLIVSHQPSFRVGDDVQLALVRAPAAEEALLAGGEALYSVVGGTSGAVAASGSLLTQAQAAGDFTLHGAKWNTMPIEYYIRTANSGVGATVATNALQAAIDEWVADPDSDVEFVYRGKTSALPTDYYDQINTLGWTSTPNSADQYLAQATWLTGSMGIASFDIKFNLDYQWADGAAPGKYDIETVNLHEIGHVLGLGHTMATEAEVMYPTIPSNATKGLGAGDRSGMANLYPAICAVASTLPNSGTGAPAQGALGGFEALNPQRILDSRETSQVGPYSTPWCPGEVRNVQVTGVGGVPTSGVTAVVAHVTSFAPTTNSALRVAPSGSEFSGAGAAKNFGTGSDRAALTNDLLILPVGSGGQVQFKNNNGETDFIVDVVGYFTLNGGAGYQELNPSRVLDSRPGSQVGSSGSPWGPGEIRDVQMTGAGGVPSTGVSAVAAHVTSFGPTANSALRVAPSGSEFSGAGAAKNFGTGSDRAALTNDLVILPVGPDGKVQFKNNNGSTHFIVDVVGYFAPAGGDQFVALNPSRVLDSRPGSQVGSSGSPWGPGEIRDVQMTGAGGVPSTGVSAVAAHVTSFGPTANSALRVAPSGSEFSGAGAAKNFGTGSDRAALTNDLVILPVGPDGKVQFKNNNGSTHFIVDVVGYFS